MIERDSIRFGDTTIEYHVRRSERRKKTVQVTIDGRGVQVAAPMDTPADDLQTLVRRRASWILNHASDESAGGGAQAFRQRGDPALSGPKRAHGVRDSRRAHAGGPFRPLAVQCPGAPRCLDDEPTSTSTSRKAIIAWYRAQGREHGCKPASRNGCHVSVVVNRSGGFDSRPASTMGQLRSGRHPAFQLARRDA